MDDRQVEAVARAICEVDCGQVTENELFRCRDLAAAAVNAYHTSTNNREQRMREALAACVDALAFLRTEGVYVWPNHPRNPEALARTALEE